MQEDPLEAQDRKLVLMPSMQHASFKYGDILSFFEEVMDRNGETAFSDFAVVLADIAEEMTPVLLEQGRFVEADKMQLAQRHFKRAADLVQQLDAELRPAIPLDPRNHEKS
jgi:hypothetical protein